MHLGAEFWVAVAFLAFIGVLLYYKVPRLIAKALDARAERIREQLDEARGLREEAQALLASYQRKERDANKEAEEIVEHARAEAKRTAERAHAELEETLKRRTRMAEQKIEQAEAKAVQQVRRLSADVAAAATRRLLRENLDEEKSSAIVDEAIGDLEKHLKH